MVGSSPYSHVCGSRSYGRDLWLTRMFCVYWIVSEEPLSHAWLVCRKTKVKSKCSGKTSAGESVFWGSGLKKTISREATFWMRNESSVNMFIVNADNIGVSLVHLICSLPAPELNFTGFYYQRKAEASLLVEDHKSCLLSHLFCLGPAVVFLPLLHHGIPLGMTQPCWM